jgi:CubicO group peptidase (beta-lactamase class C family)
LLSHQSGIPNFTKEDFARFCREPATLLELARVFWEKPLEFEPGSKYSYSSPGYHMLGLVIERVTGKPYEEMLRERIFEPLGMRDSGYDHSDVILPKRAAGYVKTPAGLRNAPYIEMANPYSAGGMYSTVLDLQKWDAALDSGQLLSREYLDLMFRPSADLGPDRASGYGWMLSTWTLPGSGRRLRVIEHVGAINGFSSIMVRFPDDHSLIVLLANILGADWSGATRGLAQILHGEEPEMPAP